MRRIIVAVREIQGPAVVNPVVVTIRSDVAVSDRRFQTSRRTIIESMYSVKKEVLSCNEEWVEDKEREGAVEGVTVPVPALEANASAPSVEKRYRIRRASRVMKRSVRNADRK